jgi:hypothetical protein
MESQAEVALPNAREDPVIAHLRLNRRMLFGIELTVLAGVVILASSSPTIGLALGLIGLVVALSAL